jgi:hypothetical protein
VLLVEGWKILDPQPSTNNPQPANNQPINDMFNFEKLEVWQEAINFADTVYTLTRAFPDEERFGLTNQMRRAAVSISSNLAEGSSRASRPDFARCSKSFHKQPFQSDRAFCRRRILIVCMAPVKNKVKC